MAAAVTAVSASRRVFFSSAALESRLSGPSVTVAAGATKLWIPDSRSCICPIGSRHSQSSVSFVCGRIAPVIEAGSICPLIVSLSSQPPGKHRSSFRTEIYGGLSRALSCGRALHSSVRCGNIPSREFLCSCFSSSPISSSSSSSADARSLRSSFVPRFRGAGIHHAHSKYLRSTHKPSVRRLPRDSVSSWSAETSAGRSPISGPRTLSLFPPGQGLGGHNYVSGKGDQFSAVWGSRTRNVTAWSSAAASAAPSQVPGGNWLQAIWTSFWNIHTSFIRRLQSIRLGWLDLLIMFRVAFFAMGAVGTYVVAKMAWARVQEMASSKAEDEGDGGPMEMLAKGATCVQANMGPWSASDMVLGLSAISKVTEKEPPALPGNEVKDLSKDSSFLQRAQHWRAVSEAVYAPDIGTFSLFSNMAESTVVAAEWEPSQESFRPAFAVYIDQPFGAVVLAIRGTSHIIDMLLNSGASAEPFGDDGGRAHGGFVQATNSLHEEVKPHIEKAFKDHGDKEELKLVVVGHSMGASVGALISLKLREKYPNLECWGYCPPAAVTLDLANECKEFTTCFVSAFDIVPRFSLHSVEKLRERIQEFDWNEVERVAKDDEDWQNVKTAIETFRKFQQAQDSAVDKVKTDTGRQALKSGKQAVESGKQTLDAEKLKGMAIDLRDKVGGYIQGGGDDDKKDGDGEESEEEKPPPPPPLYPAGRLLLLGSDPPGCGKFPEMRGDVNSQRNYGCYPNFDEAKNVTWRMYEAEPEDLAEIVVSPWLISDHMLGNLCEGIGYFQSRCPPVLK